MFTNSKLVSDFEIILIYLYYFCYFDMRLFLGSIFIHITYRLTMATENWKFLKSGHGKRLMFTGVMCRVVCGESQTHQNAYTTEGGRTAGPNSVCFPRGRFRMFRNGQDAEDFSWDIKFRRCLSLAILKSAFSGFLLCKYGTLSPIDVPWVAICVCTMDFLCLF